MPVHPASFISDVLNLHPKPGDVLVVRTRDQLTADQAAGLRDFIQAQPALQDIAVLVTMPGTNVEVQSGSGQARPD